MARAFEAKWKGKLTEAAKASGDKGLGSAIEEYDALDDLLGRIASFAGLTYFSNTSDPANGKFYGDVQSKLTDLSAHLLFFPLELNRSRRHNRRGDQGRCEGRPLRALDSRPAQGQALPAG